MLQCTECGKKTNHTHGKRWNSKIGIIIREDESLCTSCASKREGFRTLSTINAQRESNLDKDTYVVWYSSIQGHGKFNTTVRAESIQQVLNYFKNFYPTALIKSITKL